MKIDYLAVTDYTTEPYGRYFGDGDGNGEEFRKVYILPRLKNCDKLVINLDGVEDEYGSSFIVEAFANLIRKENMAYTDLKTKIVFESSNDDWKTEIDRYMREARDEQLKKMLNNG
ncbi:STAS-like domain-containing protein [Vibrio alginolyticus]|nr:STAS-like domain-containing protein [Vibrio alginolyticus]